MYWYLVLVCCRYSQPPADFWDWFSEYLEDDEEIDVKAGGGHVMTIGEMCRQFLTKLEWYSTLFPRIPVPVQKDVDIKFRVNICVSNTSFRLRCTCTHMNTSVCTC